MRPERSQSQEQLPVAKEVCKNQGTCQELVSHELTKTIKQEYLPASRTHFWREKLWMSLGAESSAVSRVLGTAPELIPLVTLQGEVSLGLLGFLQTSCYC